MKASIDAIRCQGHARCWTICPEVFELDERGHGFVPDANVPVHLEDKVESAARNCPEGAVILS